MTIIISPFSTVTIVDSFAEYRKRARLTSDLSLTLQHMIPAIADISDWGGNWKYTLTIPKELRAGNPASNQSGQFLGKIQLQMIPTAPQRWETEYRAHCYVSFPKVEPIRLVAINQGVNGSAEQPPAGSQPPASQIYSSTGDAKRSLAGQEGLFPVDLDLTGLFGDTDSSNTYKNRGGRYVPRYSFTADYNPDRVTWESIKVFVGNDSSDLLEFDLPLREDHPANSDTPFKKDVLFSDIPATVPIENHINNMMTTISEKYNWSPTDGDKIAKLRFSYFFVGTDKSTGLKVTSGEPLEKTIKTSFNLRRKNNVTHNYIADGCKGEYSEAMNSYVTSEMAQVLHYLTNDLNVKTLCNDGALPFGGEFRVNLDNQALGHKTHRDGKHLDLRYFSDQDCSAFREDGEEVACNNANGFENYYDHGEASRRVKDWDHSKEFLNQLDLLGQSNPTARDKCLSDSTTCAAAIANVIEGAQSFEVKRQIAARNLRAMDRLSRWTAYNRREWTDLTQRFPRSFIYFSPGPVKQDGFPSPARERWQQRVIFSGTIEQIKMLIKTPAGGLTTIGKCIDNLDTPTVECNLNPFPELLPGSPPPTNFKYTVKMISGHYNHIHLGLVGNE